MLKTFITLGALDETKRICIYEKLDSELILHCNKFVVLSRFEVTIIWVSRVPLYPLSQWGLVTSLIQFKCMKYFCYSLLCLSFRNASVSVF